MELNKLWYIHKTKLNPSFTSLYQFLQTKKPLVNQLEMKTKLLEQ